MLIIRYLKSAYINYILLLLMFYTTNINAQDELHVNEYTGTLSVNIPIFTIEYGDIVVPISIGYSASGIRVDVQSGTVGLGWGLNCGGSITRVNRSSPDLVEKTYLTNSNNPVTEKGYGEGYDLNCDLYRYGSNNEHSYCDVVSKTTGEENVGFEENVLQHYYGDFPITPNMEPDIFNYSFPGYSGQFIIDQEGVTHTLKGDPLKIDLVKWDEINITTPDGIIYNFKSDSWFDENNEEILKAEMGITDSDPLHWWEIQHFRSQVFTIAYCNSFSLREIKDVNNNKVVFWVNDTYNEYTSINVIEKFNYDLSSEQPFTLRINTNRIFLKSENRDRLLDSITFGNNKIEFNYVTGRNDCTDGGYNLNNIIVKNSKKEIIEKVVFHIHETYSAGVRPNNYTEFELLGLNEVIEESDPNDENSIHNAIANAPRIVHRDLDFIERIHYRILLDKIDFVNPSNDEPINTYIFDYNSIPLPSKTSCSVDLWGYYNGALNKHLVPKYRSYSDFSDMVYNYPVGDLIEYDELFADRDVDINFMKAQTLNKIIYPSKGYSTFEYEAHDCNNEPELTAIGGLRISKINYFNEKEERIKQTNYLYKKYDPQTNSFISSGKLIIKPQIASFFGYLRGLTPIQDLDGVMKNLLQRYGLSTMPWAYSNYIGYENVTIIDGDYSLSNSEIISNNGFVRKHYFNNIWENYRLLVPIFTDKRNGLLTKIEYYNNSNNLLKQTTYSFEKLNQSSHYGLVIIGDYNEEIAGWNVGVQNCQQLRLHPYQVNCEQIRLTSTINEEYQAGNLNNKITSTTTYGYVNDFRNEPSIISTTKSDGNTINQRIKYSYDFGNELNTLMENKEGTGDAQSLAIKNMFDKKNYNKPVEILTTIGSGSGEKVIGSQLIYYANEGINGFSKPVSQFTKEITAPTTYNSTTSWSSFNYNATSKLVSFVNSANYVSLGSTEYNSIGNEVLTTTNIGQYSSVIYGYKNEYPIAVITNGKENLLEIGDEVGHLNFESGASCASTVNENNHWVINNLGSFVYKTSVPPHTGDYCYQLPTGSTVLIRNFIPTNSNQKFKFSCWVKTPSSVSGYILCLLKNPTTNTDYSSPIIYALPATGNTWQLVEFEIDLPQKKTSFGLSSTDNIKLQFQFNKTSGVCYIDDIRFHPSLATMTTYTYKPLVGITSQTDPSNRSIFYEYDEFGRQIRVRDEQGYILQEKQYNTAVAP